MEEEDAVCLRWGLGPCRCLRVQREASSQGCARTPPPSAGALQCRMAESWTEPARGLAGQVHRERKRRARVLREPTPGKRRQGWEGGSDGETVMPSLSVAATGRSRNGRTWGPKGTERKRMGQWLEGKLEVEVVQAMESREMGRAEHGRCGQDGVDRALTERRGRKLGQISNWVYGIGYLGPGAVLTTVASI